VEKARIEIPNVSYCTNPYQAAQGADAILIITEWDEFRQLNCDRLGRMVERSLIVDGRNMLNTSEVASHGFQYFSVGRPPVLPAPSVSAASNLSSLEGTDREPQTSLLS
jgi:UDPglucose 6-dehydrogenase